MAFELLGDKLQAIVKKVKGQSKLTEQNMEEMIKEIRISLLEADVNYKVVKEFTNNVKEQAIGQNVLSTLSPGQMILKIIKNELVTSSKQSKVFFLQPLFSQYPWTFWIVSRCKDKTTIFPISCNNPQI